MRKTVRALVLVLAAAALALGIGAPAHAQSVTVCVDARVVVAGQTVVDQEACQSQAVPPPAP